LADRGWGDPLLPEQSLVGKSDFLSTAATASTTPNEARYARLGLVAAAGNGTSSSLPRLDSPAPPL